jgi:alpha-ketoglutarate-dependent 2,4-dichlorophenoxyacetate dioxygenase
MPSAAEQEFKTIQIQKLHPTFGAEISGVDYSKPIPDDVFQEIRDASAKVCASSFSPSLSLIC